MMEILSHNTTAWVAISFVIFVALMVKVAGAKITGALDKKIAEIKQDIETAQNLKSEAEALLAEFRDKQRDAEAAAANIIAQAKESARAVQAASDAELAETMARREAQLLERLKRIEEQALIDLQNHAADLSVAATRELVMKHMDEKTSGKLVDQAIHSVSRYLA